GADVGRSATTRERVAPAGVAVELEVLGLAADVDLAPAGEGHGAGLVEVDDDGTGPGSDGDVLERDVLPRAHERLAVLPVEGAVDVPRSAGRTGLRVRCRDGDVARLGGR